MSRVDLLSDDRKGPFILLEIRLCRELINRRGLVVISARRSSDGRLSWV